MNLYCLAKYPEVCKKVNQEIEENIPDFDNFEYDTLKNKLPYCSAFLSEVLRHYPPLPSVAMRKCTNSFKTADHGINFDKDTLVFSNNFDSMMNPKYFDDPKEFKPERWLGKNSHPAYAYVPFSAGPRNCIG